MHRLIEVDAYPDEVIFTTAELTKLLGASRVSETWKTGSVSLSTHLESGQVLYFHSPVHLKFPWWQTFFVLRAIKTVQQTYTPSKDLLDLLEQFRKMLNDCIRIGLAENITSMKSLSQKAYRELSEYDTPSYYKLCAISKAAGILRNYKKACRKKGHVKDPYARRLQLVTCYGFKIKNDKLLLPLRHRLSISIPLNPHTTSTISHPGLTVRSITLTESRLAITYVKVSVPIHPKGAIALDRNLNNVMSAASDALVLSYDLTKATEIKAVYREIKSHAKRNDHRVRRRIFVKYGRRERNRVQQILHQTSKCIVEDAKKKQYAIAMEKLTGIRKLYRKGNGQGCDYRGRMNSWSYAELQRQIEYKARWDGIPVIYVNPRGTSARCSICGSGMKPEENRKLKCRSCGFTVDRDVNAARNILARAVRFAAVAPASEAMVAVQRRKVDAGELTSRYTPTS